MLGTPSKSSELKNRERRGRTSVPNGVPDEHKRVEFGRNMPFTLLIPLR
jgi:hypothetical protein